MLSFFSSPSWMTIVNTAGGIWAVLESTGVTNVLGTSKWGGIALAAVAGVNAFAHAISQPVAGPAAASVGTNKPS
jgi:hypothetical protein